MLCIICMQVDHNNSSLNASFNIELPFEQPSDVAEQNLTDDSVYNDEENIPTCPVAYTMIETATQRGKPKLVDSAGFSYTLKREKNGHRTWLCSVRNKSVKCGVIVHERDGVFQPPTIQHNHQSTPGIITATRIKVMVKERSLQQIHKPARTIVEDVMGEMVDLREPEGSRPNPDYLTRAVNRERQSLLPECPRDLSFELDIDFLPDDFFRKDIHYDNQRHLIFASNRQLELLAQSKTWYIDGTFKVIRDPFKQLLSIHAFIRSDSDTKQLPLVFCVMSRRTKKDYKKVLQAILEMLPDQHINVQLFVADFERGLWKALRSVFDNPAIQGCVFHWTQAIWRKTQEIGLQQAYYQKDSVYKFVRKLMALPFLPAEHIPATFETVAAKAHSARTNELADYVNNTWINSTVWDIASWSIFRRSVRTNNDVEGWHRRLNDRATGACKPFYELLQLLHEEAFKVPLQVRLVSEGKLRRCQRKRTRQLQGRIFTLWIKYSEHSITTRELLKKVTRLNGPSTS